MKARVVDNGLRCLVPPCYSWNLVTSDGRIIDKVAEIVDELGNSISPSGADRVWEGDLEEYSVRDGPNAGISAKRFITKHATDW